MKLEIPLLGLLASHPMSGYDVKKWTEIEGKFFALDRHASQIYRELNRMHVNGWLAFAVDPRDSVPDAKVYSVTDAGMDRLWRWVESPYEPPRMFQDPEFKFRLRFSMMLDEDVARSLVAVELEARRRLVRENRGRTRIDDPLAARPEVHPEALRWIRDQLNSNGERSIDAWIAWLEELTVVLEGRRIAASVDADVVGTES